MQQPVFCKFPLIGNSVAIVHETLGEVQAQFQFLNKPHYNPVKSSLGGVYQQL
jgi:hypothetical protein